MFKLVFKKVLKLKIMKPNRYLVYFSIILLFILAYCAEENVLYDDPMLLDMEEFTFIPKIPGTKEDVKMVYYGCGYNETSSISINNKNIKVIKKFNGAMKRPCILERDTIPLGKLEKGSYKVTLDIIDINPFAQDTLFHTETKTLIVGP